MFFRPRRGNKGWRCRRRYHWLKLSVPGWDAWNEHFVIIQDKSLLERRHFPALLFGDPDLHHAPATIGSFDTTNAERYLCACWWRHNCSNNTATICMQEYCHDSLFCWCCSVVERIGRGHNVALVNTIHSKARTTIEQRTCIIYHHIPVIIALPWRHDRSEQHFFRDITNGVDDSDLLWLTEHLMLLYLLSDGSWMDNGIWSSFRGVTSWFLVGINN